MNENFETLVGEFVNAAMEYGTAITGGNSRKTKAHLDQVSKVYRELRQQGEIAQRSLIKLLENDEIAVRYMAAVYTLDFEPTSGERVLNEIIGGPPSPIRMLAQTSLSQWQSGHLNF
jgi:hypothetical protein